MVLQDITSSSNDSSQTTGQPVFSNLPTVQRPLPAICALPLLIGFVTFSLVTGKFLTFAVFLTILTAGCGFYAFISRYRVRIECQIPSRLMEGDAVDLVFLIKSASRLPCLVARAVMETVHPAGTSADHAGWQHRRRRYKLFPRQNVDVPTQNTVSPTLEAEEFQMDGFILFRGGTRICRKLQLQQRGLIEFDTLRLYFTDPLGMFLCRRTFRVKHHLLVRVRPALGGTRLRISNASGRFETQITVGETGEMTEYAGTRPYRTGDELRHIHWPTVARTDELYVREYTPSSAESVAVLLLRSSPATSGLRTTPADGEFLLRCTVTLLLELFERRVQTGFGTDLDHGFGITIGSSRRQLQHCHDAISTINWGTPDDAALNFLKQLEFIGTAPPSIIIFGLSLPSIAAIDEICRYLRVTPRQITLILPENKRPAQIPPRDITILTCNAQHPEIVFQQLLL